VEDAIDCKDVDGMLVFIVKKKGEKLCSAINVMLMLSYPFHAVMQTHTPGLTTRNSGSRKECRLTSVSLPTYLPTYWL